ncbi:MAG TPA: sugar ABC transporter ATP-binding protein [Woeseiaceae bacterium]|nr:sugar ABC transporter ATP-binding protein [Woeseiaceae bacterium]
MTVDDDVVLEVQGISKAFPGVQALADVSLTLRHGRLTALLGENGAGKSTLMNIVAGVLEPDAGEIRLAGEPVRFASPREAQAAGIAMIYQELNLVPGLTVAENIFLGREPLNRFGLVDTPRMHREATRVLEALDLAVAPGTPLGRLRVGQQQVVEIAKAISTEARILIMDEPTSAITAHETEVLFGIIESLKAQGVAIAYITHRLEELTRIGDDAVVMRDGRLIDAAPLANLDREAIVRMMVGREMRARPARTAAPPAGEALRIANLSLPHPERPGGWLVRDVDLAVGPGEVLGVFGLMGAGRTELLETLFGLHPRAMSGEVFVDGAPARFRSPADAIARGIVLAPEDRKREGLVPGMTVGENLSLACLADHTRFGLVDEAAEARQVDDAIARLSIKTPSAREAVRNLSGGNQQKVILGKWLATRPRVLLLDEPTRGIDVNAKEEIYALIEALRSEGLAVVVVSSELPEILALADRIAVLSEGRKTGEFSRGEADVETLMRAALPGSLATGAPPVLPA